MKTAFADTGYWIALLYPADALHSLAQALHRAIDTQLFQIVTSEMVLTELINFFSKRGSQLRQQSVAFVVQIQQSPKVTVIPQATEQFNQALQFYAQRKDKEWSQGKRMKITKPRF